jgi:hypothetical protein
MAFFVLSIRKRCSNGAAMAVEHPRIRLICKEYEQTRKLAPFLLWHTSLTRRTGLHNAAERFVTQRRPAGYPPEQATQT